MAQNAPFRALLMSLLNLTNGDLVEVEKLRGSMKMTAEAFNGFVYQLEEAGLVTVEAGSIELSLDQRLGLAMRAVEVGADFEAVSRSLGWLEFEELSARVFEENGFRVLRRFRFNANGRRWELDLLATRAPYLVCGECKHWSNGIGNKTARSIIETHLEKVEMFSHHLPELMKRGGLEKWVRAIVVPMALTLSATPMEIYRRVPSVSVLALPRFLNEFDGQLERLAHFRVELPLPEVKPKQTVLKKKDVRGSRRVRY
jgi:Holliday junction resolvase-like predicted endonuclease